MSHETQPVDQDEYARTLRERWLLAKALATWARGRYTREEDDFLTATVDEARRILASEPEPPARTGLADPPRWTAGFDRSAEIPALEARVKKLEEEKAAVSKNRDDFYARWAALEASRLSFVAERDAALAQVSALEAKRADLQARHEKLGGYVIDLEAKVKAMERCLAFFASAIKSGEPWSATCEAEYRKALAASSPTTGETAVNPLAARVGELEKGLGKMLDFFEAGLEDDGALKSSHPDWIRLARGLFSLSRRLLSPTGETAP